LLCLHTGRDVLDFAVLAVAYFIPFLAGMILGRHWVALFVWLLLAAVFFGYVEALVLCRHCPH
jgi:4-hydroxybenzoate polyprenyltransferase